MVAVVKVGGSLVAEGRLENVLADIPAALKIESIVLVHGGGQTVTQIAEKLGKKQTFVTSPSGVRSRYTDSETAEIYSMVMSGLVAGRIVTRLSGFGVIAFSFSGLDGSFILAERKKKLLITDERGRKMAIEGGFTGRVTKVNSALLKAVMGMGVTPVISPVAIGTESEILNIDGDRAASAVSASLPSDSLLLLTNVDGLMLDGHVVKRMTTQEARAALPRIGAGMDKKVIGAVEAVEGGVSKCIIAPGNVPQPVTAALRGETGTVITNE